jgi:hypothetical protein
MKNTFKDDIRQVATGVTLCMAIFMLVVTLFVSVSEGGPMSVSESLLMGALFGVPASIAFYLSIGRETVGGFPAAIVIAVGCTAAGTVMLLFGCGWGLLTIVLSGALLISVQLLCNKLDERVRH